MVTPETSSASEADDPWTGRAVPGPARMDEKWVVEV